MKTETRKISTLKMVQNRDVGGKIPLPELWSMALTATTEADKTSACDALLKCSGMRELLASVEAYGYKPTETPIILADGTVVTKHRSLLVNRLATLADVRDDITNEIEVRVVDCSLDSSEFDTIQQIENSGRLAEKDTDHYNRWIRAVRRGDDQTAKMIVKSQFGGRKELSDATAAQYTGTLRAIAGLSKGKSAKRVTDELRQKFLAGDMTLAKVHAVAYDDSEERIADFIALVPDATEAEQGKIGKRSAADYAKIVRADREDSKRKADAINAQASTEPSTDTTSIKAGTPIENAATPAQSDQSKSVVVVSGGGAAKRDVGEASDREANEPSSDAPSPEFVEPPEKSCAADEIVTNATTQLVEILDSIVVRVLGKVSKDRREQLSVEFTRVCSRQLTAALVALTK